MSVESQLATLKRSIRWALRDLKKIMADVDLSDPDAARDRLQAELPSLIVVWGEIAATQAAEYFEDLIDAPAVLAEPIVPEAVELMVGWAVGPLYGEKQPDGRVTPPNPAQTRKNLEGAFQRYVMGPHRNTIRYSAESVPGVGWARILQGEENCAFCVVLASRGAVYESAENAGAQTESDDPRVKYGDRYHDACDCAVIPIRDDGDYPEGYSVDAYYEMYMDARRNASPHPELEYKTLKGGDNNILTQMRKMYGMH